MKTAGYIDMLPYSRDGFVVGGFKDKSGVLHMQNIRIYKQRSNTVYDLIDISTNEIFQKVTITSHPDNSVQYLDYTLPDLDLAQQIKKNSFFIRNFDKYKNYYGFIVRVHTHKVTIDSSDGQSHYIFNYDLYIKDEPQIFSITYNQPSVGDTSFSFVVNGQFLDPATLTSKITMQDGTVYIGTSVGFQVTFDNVLFSGDEITVLVEANGAIDYTEVIPLLQDNVPNEITSEVIVNQSDWIYIPVGDDYAYTILPDVHNRGELYAIQTFEGVDMTMMSATLDHSGALTLVKNDDTPVKVRFAGQSDQLDMIVLDISTSGWVATSDDYMYSISSNLVGRPFSVYNLWVDRGTRYQLSSNGVSIDLNGNIVITSNEPYNAKLVIV